MKIAWPSRRFLLFLCHHKAGGGVLARWLHLLAEKQTGIPIFLDSDFLDDLERIFDIVKEDVDVVVALLTQLTLTRMWCAGELATACLHGVTSIAVIAESIEEPDAGFFSTAGGRVVGRGSSGT